MFRIIVTIFALAVIVIINIQPMLQGRNDMRTKGKISSWTSLRRSNAIGVSVIIVCFYAYMSFLTK